MQNLSKHLFLGLVALVFFTTYTSAQSMGTNLNKSSFVTEVMESNDDQSHQAVNLSAKTPKGIQLQENQQLVEINDNGRKRLVVGTMKLTPEQKLLKRREEAVVLHHEHMSTSKKLKK